MSKPKFVYTTYIRTTPDKLWEALTGGDFTKQYWGGYRIESDWKIGSPMKFYAADGSLAHSDRVLEADRPKVLSYTWKPLGKNMPDEPPSTVTFELEQKGEFVKLTVTHSEFPEDSKMFPMISNGWPMVISSLKTMLETGKSLDFAFLKKTG